MVYLSYMEVITHGQAPQNDISSLIIFFLLFSVTVASQITWILFDLLHTKTDIACTWKKFPSQMNKIQEKRLSVCIGVNTKFLATMGLYLVPNVLIFLQRKKTWIIVTPRINPRKMWSLVLCVLCDWITSSVFFFNSIKGESMEDQQMLGQIERKT